ncbi:MAG: leucyl aminopeptidase [Nocardioidaceae bacterium]|nr:MAG: leucyl aminopeptidase [Nocardioidaceae bacterium]
MDQNLLNALCLQQLTLSKVQEPETVAVLTRGSERTDLVDAFLWAAQQLGASAFHLRLPPSQSTSGAWEVGDSGLSRNPRAVEALKGVDMVIDLAFLLFSKEQFEIQGAGTRILTTLEIPEVLGRLMPTPELRERVEFGVETLQAAQSLRVTSPAGTDVTYRLGAYPTLGEYGYTDEPGRWDYWPAAFVFTGAADDGVDGTIVLSPGDILLPWNTYVQTPVTFTIEAGFITDIRGDLDADLLSAYIKSFNDPRAYGMSHVGWGLDERANWHSLAPTNAGAGMESRSFYGNVMWSIGPNNELGGPNDTPCHFDIPMRGCSLFLDDKPIVVDGTIPIREMQPFAWR